MEFRILLSLLISCGVSRALGQIRFPDESGPEVPQHHGPMYFCDNVGGRISLEAPAHLMNQSTVFSLGVKDVKCGYKSVSRNFSLGQDSGSEFQFLPDGYLKIETSEGSDYFSKSQYCISRLTDSRIFFKICQPSCTAKEPCIRKCCPLGSVYKFGLEVRGCYESGPKKWTPKIFTSPKDPSSLIQEQDVPKLNAFYQLRGVQGFKEHCIDETDTTGQGSHVRLFPYSQRMTEELLIAGYDMEKPLRFRVGADGRVLLRDNRRKWSILPQDHYCVDGVSIDNPLDYNNTLEEEIIFSCPPPSESSVRSVSEYYGIFAICTSFFALVTVIVYFLLFEKQTIHGWTTQSHSASVFLFFIFIGAAHLSIDSTWIHGSAACKFIGTLAHYFFISTFCWLLCISFDLWSTFRSISAPSRKKGFRRFMGYCAFAWGFPLLVITVSWTLEAMYKDDEDSEIAVPNYGENFCYLVENFYWEFIYGPIAVLMGINLVLFTFTAFKLYQFQQSTKMATQSINKDRQSFMLFVKLFFVVGSLWIFEIISFSVSGAHVSWYWQIFDSLNLLQPIAIFVIFVLKWEIIIALHDRYTVLRPILYPAKRLLEYLCPKEVNKTRANSESSHSTGLNSSITAVSKN